MPNLPYCISELHNKTCTVHLVSQWLSSFIAQITSKSITVDVIWIQFFFFCFYQENLGLCSGTAAAPNQFGEVIVDMESSGQCNSEKYNEMKEMVIIS